MDDDAWVERLQHVIAADGDVDLTDRPSNGIVVRTASSADILTILRGVEERLAALEADVGELRRRHETLVGDVAEAVIERLDARWGRIVDEG